MVQVCHYDDEEIEIETGRESEAKTIPPIQIRAKWATYSDGNESESNLKKTFMATI